MENKAAVTTAIAVGGVLVLGLGLWHKNKNGKKSIQQQQKEAAEESFESHVCKHDGKGLVTLSPSTLWHVTLEFHGNGPPWRRMIVYKPPGGAPLILLSPSAVTEDVMEALEALGSVDYLIVPNSYHRTDAAVFKKRYPSAKIACPPGWVRKGVSEVVPVDMDARELEKIFPDSVKVIRIGGLCDEKEAEGDFEYAYEFKCSDGTWAYAVTDTLFNIPGGGFMNWVFGSGGIDVKQDDCTSGDGCIAETKTSPRVGRLSKWLMHSRADCAKFYLDMADRDDVSMILMAHGNIVVVGQQGTATTTIKEAFRTIAADVNNTKQS